MPVVVVTDACLRMRCTRCASTPALSMSVAAVWRRSPSRPPSRAPSLTAALEGMLEGRRQGTLEGSHVHVDAGPLKDVTRTRQLDQVRGPQTQLRRHLRDGLRP